MNTEPLITASNSYQKGLEDGFVYAMVISEISYMGTDLRQLQIMRDKHIAIINNCQAEALREPGLNSDNLMLRWVGELKGFDLAVIYLFGDRFGADKTN